MIFSEGKGVNLLSFPIDPTGNSTSQLIRVVGKPLASDSKGTGPVEFFEKAKFQNQIMPLGREKLSRKRDQILTEKPEVFRFHSHPKAKKISRWEAFAKHVAHETQSSDKSTLGSLWNYFLGESKASDCFCYQNHTHKENLTMAVEPNENGFALYVFWKSEGFGPYGIIFYYEPEKENPIRIEILSEGKEAPLSHPSDPSLKQMLQDLIRDFPQIGGISFGEWDDTNYNGDYR